ncbi:MAG: T9SS type A sorting domain-containing protein [Saprospiraceae bacterium]|nr:T9SS type A sorting domain-containing protein [Saprospiraceae bacterium]
MDPDQIRIPADGANFGTWEATYTQGGCSKTVNFVVNLKPSAVGGTISPATQSITTTANGIVPTRHTLSGNGGNVIRWEFQTPNSTVWNNWNGSGSTTVPNNCCFNTVGTWKVRALDNNGCGEVPSTEGLIIVTDPCATPINATITGENEVCANTTTTITASGGSTYKWSNGATTASITVGVGTYTVTVSNAAGCSAIAAKAIATKATTISVANCPQNISLTATTNNCAATWTAPTFTANCGTPSVSSTHNSGFCFPVGSTTVIYTATLNGVSKTCSFTVTVNAPAKGSIGDFVFSDNNNNSVFDNGDTPLSNVTVTLCNSAGQTITTAVTNATGNYTFSNLNPATYIVKFPASLADGKNLTTTNPITVNLSAGQNYLNADAGYYKPAVPTCPDGTPKKTPGSACNDNNPNTTNDVIQADGCGCAGTPVTPNCNENRNNTITKSCVSGKPVLSGTALVGYEYMWISSTTTCAVNGSQPIPEATGQNYYLPSNVTQTTYFSRRARPIDCTEWGAIAESNCITVTPADCGTSAGGCDAISVVGNTNGTISISGLGAFTSMVQIFNSQWQPVFSQQYNTPTASIPVKNGGYIVKVQLYNTNGTWQFVCEKMVTGINVSGGTFSLASGRVVLDLAATPELHTVKIAWANNTGYKNDYFEVEKLNEKSSAFEKIAIVNSQNGDKLEYYTAFDEQPTEGDNIYRINLVGTDGTTKVSNQSVVKFNKAYDFRIFPNPASDFIEVDLKQYEGKNATIQVYNSFGTIVSTQHIEKVSAQPVHVDLGQAPAGQYLIRVSSDGKKQAAKKFVIQN